MAHSHHSTAHNSHSDLGEVDSPSTLITVYVIILALLAATVLISMSGSLGRYTLFAQLAISSIQATIVGCYFMHLRHSDRVVTLTALASVFWLFILFVLFMSDYMTRHMVVSG